MILTISFHKKITKELDDCLLTTEEFESDWSQLPEPYGWHITQA